MQLQRKMEDLKISVSAVHVDWKKVENPTHRQRKALTSNFVKSSWFLYMDSGLLSGVLGDLLFYFILFFITKMIFVLIIDWNRDVLKLSWKLKFILALAWIFPLGPHDHYRKWYQLPQVHNIFPTYGILLESLVSMLS